MLQIINFHATVDDAEIPQGLALSIGVGKTTLSYTLGGRAGDGARIGCAEDAG